MADCGEPIIRVRGLKNSFGEQIVHEDLDLDVRRGEILGVVGGSGTGKSVLMRSIIGLQPPYTGEITVFGENALSVDEARSEEHTSELQSLMRNSYAVVCLQKK